MTSDIRHYMATGALSDPRVMGALLGKIPPSFEMDVHGFSLGLVHGYDLNRIERFDVVPNDFVSRILINDDPKETVRARFYSNMNRLDHDLTNMFTLEGMATQVGIIPIGNGHDSVGEAYFHVKKNGVLYEELDPEDREKFPNGLEATILAAEQARSKFLEKFGPSPERR